ncbi:MAG: methyltransferase domain-containing protein [Actinomycetota bacterium]|nr:methyltransferase domain-containing protein [Actinomycetota bacterium]
MAELLEAYRSFADEHCGIPERWLLDQSIGLASLYDVVAGLIAQRSSGPVLDLGTGYGPIAIRLAAMGLGVVGVDRDQRVLHGTEEIASRCLGHSARARFVTADATRLPLPDRAGFRLVTASLLLEHVADPGEVAAEAFRVLGPDGTAAFFDVDDGLGAEHPQTPALLRLGEALSAWQSGYGGDRRVGRKIPGLLADAGFGDVEVYVLPQARFSVTSPGSEERRLTAEHLGRAREGIVGTGLLSEERFDGLVAEYLHAPARQVCQIEGRVLAFGRKAGDAARRRGAQAALRRQASGARRSA